jgi:hypothetical protein
VSAHPKFLAGLAERGMPPVRPEEVVEARRLRAEGRKLREIAKEMGRVISTIHYMLKGEYGDGTERGGEGEGVPVGDRIQGAVRPSKASAA